MIEKGVSARKIKFVVSLRGLSVAFVTDEFLTYDPVGQEIRGYLDSLMSKGVRIEACIISCQWVGVAPDTLKDGVLVIDNAFASSIFYQRRGYALIPVHQLP
jgi:intracellular sulfur oxidation DsrE/DsrF family protein